MTSGFVRFPCQLWTGAKKTGSPPTDRFVGLVARRPPREWKIAGSNSACAGIFSGSSHASDSKIGTPVATLPGAWRYRVSAGTGQPGVSTLWLGEVESWIWTSISVWQHVKLPEQIRPWDTLACCWDVKQPTNKQTPPTLESQELNSRFLRHTHFFLCFPAFCCCSLCCCFFPTVFCLTDPFICILFPIALFKQYSYLKNECDYLLGG